MKEAAIRELQEETGLLTKKIKEIGTLWLAPGQLYLAQNGMNITLGYDKLVR